MSTTQPLFILFPHSPFFPYRITVWPSYFTNSGMILGWPTKSSLIRQIRTYRSLPLDTHSFPKYGYRICFSRTKREPAFTTSQYKTDWSVSYLMAIYFIVWSKYDFLFVFVFCFLFCFCFGCCWFHYHWLYLWKKGKRLFWGKLRKIYQFIGNATVYIVLHQNITLCLLHKFFF